MAYIPRASPWVLRHEVITIMPLLANKFIASETVQFVIGCIEMSVVTFTLLLIKAGYYLITGSHTHKTVGTVTEIEVKVEDDEPKYKVDYFCNGNAYSTYITVLHTLGEYIDVFVNEDNPENGFTSIDFEIYRSVHVIVFVWAIVVYFFCGDLIMW